MNNIIAYLKNNYWTTVAIATILPGVASTAIEYMITNGSSGWIPLSAALIGGCFTALTLVIIKTSEQPPKIHTLSETKSSRIPCPRTPAELIEKIEGCTEIQAEHITQPYLGQWMEIEGNVDDVSERLSGDEISVYIWSEVKPSFFLIFDSNTWGTQIRSFDVGDHIIAVGKIKSISRLGTISLEECELINNMIPTA